MCQFLMTCFLFRIVQRWKNNRNQATYPVNPIIALNRHLKRFFKSLTAVCTPSSCVISLLMLQPLLYVLVSNSCRTLSLWNCIDLVVIILAWTSLTLVARSLMVCAPWETSLSRSKTCCSTSHCGKLSVNRLLIKDYTWLLQISSNSKGVRRVPRVHLNMLWGNRAWTLESEECTSDAKTDTLMLVDGLECCDDCLRPCVWKPWV